MSSKVSENQPTAETLRLTTWNCRAGSVAARLADLEPLAPDLVFLQECDPRVGLPLNGEVATRRVNDRKAVALAAPTGRVTLTPLTSRPDTSAGCLAVHVGGREPFHVIGIWAQGRAYVDDTLRTLHAHADLFAAGPVIVLGDFNSGACLTPSRRVSQGHDRLAEALSNQFGLVSAYHSHHRCVAEAHPTYFHQFKEADAWHIDFCFLPADWIHRLVDVSVGGFDEWKDLSDHRPVTVTLSTEG